MEYNAGDIIKGKVTGIKPYGAFITLEDNYTGLLHISEISDDFVNHIEDFIKFCGTDFVSSDFARRAPFDAFVPVFGDNIFQDEKMHQTRRRILVEAKKKQIAFSHKNVQNPLQFF